MRCITMKEVAQEHDNGAKWHFLVFSIDRQEVESHNAWCDDRCVTTDWSEHENMSVTSAYTLVLNSNEPNLPLCSWRALSLRGNCSASHRWQWRTRVQASNRANDEKESHRLEANSSGRVVASLQEHKSQNISKDLHTVCKVGIRNHFRSLRCTAYKLHLCQLTDVFARTDVTDVFANGRHQWMDASCVTSDKSNASDECYHTVDLQLCFSRFATRDRHFCPGTPINHQARNFFMLVDISILTDRAINDKAMNEIIAIT